MIIIYHKAKQDSIMMVHTFPSSSGGLNQQVSARESSRNDLSLNSCQIGVPPSLHVATENCSRFTDDVTRYYSEWYGNGPGSGNGMWSSDETGRGTLAPVTSRAN